MRKHYLDNLRWATVLSVLVYHVFYLFNSVGVLGGLGPFQNIQYQDAILYLLYPWFMALLFLIAGISSRCALAQRTPKEFIRSRTRKLLVPATLGLFVLQWPVGYLNIKMGGALDTIPAFIRYPVFVLSGTGPLWFAQTLWLFSLLLIVIRRLDKKDRVYQLCGTIGKPAIIALGLLLWGGSQILNMPVITVYRFGIYFTAFLLGYFVFAHDSVEEKLLQMHLPLLFCALILGVVFTLRYFGTNYTEDACLKSFLTNLYAWIMILAMLGCGKAWFDKTSPIASYFTGSSYGIYVVHYLVCLFVCYYLKSTALPAFLIYILSICATFIGSVALYELLRRIPIIRYLTLGIK